VESWMLALGTHTHLTPDGNSPREGHGSPRDAHIGRSCPDDAFAALRLQNNLPLSFLLFRYPNDAK